MPILRFMLGFLEYCLCVDLVASLHLQDLSPADFGQAQSGLSDTVVVPYRPIP